VIFHQADPLLSHPILGGLPAFASGLTDLNHQPRSVTNALDYSRAPLFDWPTGVALPPTGPGDADDLQDVVSHHLSTLKAAGGELFVFGSHFHDPAPAGIAPSWHRGADIHMNRVNEQVMDNGALNDGGLILKFGPRQGVLRFRLVPAHRRAGQPDSRRSGDPRKFLRRSFPTHMGIQREIRLWSVVIATTPPALTGVLHQQASRTSAAVQCGCRQLSTAVGPSWLLNPAGTGGRQLCEEVEGRLIRFFRRDALAEPP
jgi:hypothetical protein